MLNGRHGDKLKKETKENEQFSVRNKKTIIPGKEGTNTDHQFCTK